MFNEFHCFIKNGKKIFFGKSFIFKILYTLLFLKILSIFLIPIEIIEWEMTAAFLKNCVIENTCIPLLSKTTIYVS